MECINAQQIPDQMTMIHSKPISTPISPKHLLEGE